MAPDDGTGAGARRSRRRGGAKGRRAQVQAADGLPTSWPPPALPGAISYRTPSTIGGYGSKIVMEVFGGMFPMADFSEAQCDVLRKIVVARLERIDQAPWAGGQCAGDSRLLAHILRALLAERAAKARLTPARWRLLYPGDSNTALVRFLGAYLKAVEDAECLVLVSRSPYCNFQRAINDACAQIQAREAEADGDDAVDDSFLEAVMRVRDRTGSYPSEVAMLSSREWARLVELETAAAASSGDESDEGSDGESSARSQLEAIGEAAEESVVEPVVVRRCMNKSRVAATDADGHDDEPSGSDSDPDAGTSVAHHHGAA